jgi:hypothetical protein
MKSAGINLQISLEKKGTLSTPFLVLKIYFIHLKSKPILVYHLTFIVC